MLARTQEAPKLGGQSGTIGGSNVAAILGKSPWADAHSVWETMIFGRDDKTSEAIERGTRLEPIVAELFKRRHPSLVCMEPSVETILHPSDDRFTASIDLEAWHQEGTIAGLVELKTANQKADWWDAPPEHYHYQLQHYLWIRGVKRGWFCCLQADEKVFRMIETIEDAEKAIRVKSARLHIHAVELDPKYEREVVPVLRKFYEDHIETQTPPPVDESKRCEVLLKRIYPYSEGFTELSERTVKALRSFHYWGVEEKKAASERQKAKNIIREENHGHLEAIDAVSLAKVRAAKTEECMKAAIKEIQQSVRIGKGHAVSHKGVEI